MCSYVLTIFLISGNVRLFVHVFFNLFTKSFTASVLAVHWCLTCYHQLMVIFLELFKGLLRLEGIVYVFFLILLFFFSFGRWQFDQKVSSDFYLQALVAFCCLPRGFFHFPCPHAPSRYRVTLSKNSSCFELGFVACMLDCTLRRITSGLGQSHYL